VNRQEYYAIITHMDTQLGRILEALRQLGEEENTYVFFTSDHGLAVGQHGLLGKQNMHEHSIRVPFLVTGPGLPGGKRIDTPIYLQDVMPTTLELAQVTRPEHVQFQSLLPLLRGENRRPYEAIYGAYLQLQRMVMEGDFKLILYPKIGRVLLYNVKEDPQEMVNLAENARFRDTVKRLFSRLLSLQRETGDTLDLKSSFPQLAGR
jgi:choline-sulfatase